MQSTEVKQIRQAAGLSQRELAEFLNLKPASGPRTVRAWELGEIPVSGPAITALTYLQEEISNGTWKKNS